MRSHDWDIGGRPGATCRRAGCGKRYGEIRRKGGTQAPPRPLQFAGVHSTNPAPSIPRETEIHGTGQVAAAARPAPTGAPISDARFERLRAQLGTPAPATTPAPANDNAAGETPAKGPLVDKVALGKLVDIIGPLAPQVVVGIEASIVRWAGRVPEVPDEDLVAGLRKCTDLLITQSLPNVEIGPWGGLAIYSTMIFLSMYMGAEKLPPVAAKPQPTTTASPPATARTPATVPATGKSGLTLVPPAPAEETHTTTPDESEPGNASSAQDGSSEDDGGTDSA